MASGIRINGLRRTRVAGLFLGLLGIALPALAAPPDWGKVPAKAITVFYPGASPMEWITKGSEHGGARALKKGESCASCHADEAADMGKKIVSGQSSIAATKSVPRF